MEDRETARMRKYGESKRLELWWQLYRTSLPVWDLENFRPMDFCWHECTAPVKTVPTYLHCYPTVFPRSPHHNSDIYHTVGRHYLFSVDISPCSVLSAIGSQLFPRHALAAKIMFWCVHRRQSLNDPSWRLYVPSECDFDLSPRFETFSCIWRN